MTNAPKITSGMAAIDYYAPHCDDTPRTAKPQPSYSWGLAKNLLDTYAEHLAALQLDDPTTATDCHDRARLLLAQAKDITAGPAVSDTRATVERDLATGKITPEMAEKKLDRIRAAENTASARDLKDSLSRAALSAYADGLASLRAYGEKRWLDLLRPLGGEAIEDADDERWLAVHDFAGFLRKVGGMETLTCPPSYWRYGALDELHAWMLASGTGYEVTRMWAGANDGITFMERRATGYPRVTAEIIREHPEWKPGIYTAAEVLANLRDIRARLKDKTQADLRRVEAMRAAKLAV